MPGDSEDPAAGDGRRVDRADRPDAGPLLYHERAGGARSLLATDVEFADTLTAKVRGLMFRSVPGDFALVFRFSEVDRRSVHMLFVREALDVLWLRDGTVERIETLQPWRGFALDRADALIELPAGAADGVEAGDAVWVDQPGGGD